MMDRIHLLEAQLHCRVGVPPEERSEPQPIIVDLTLEFDLSRAAGSGSVADTIDYDGVLTVIEEIAASREWVLIESIAEAMCDEVLARYSAKAVRILLRKPQALRARGVRYAAVEMERRRDG